MHHPFQDIGSPTQQPTLCIPPSKSVPLKSHQEKRAPLPGQLNHPVASWQSPYSFWSHYSRASVLGVLPAPITLAVPIPLLPRPLATLAVASHHFVESSALATVEQAVRGRGEMTMQIFMSFPGTLGVAQEMSAFQKVTLFFQP